MSGLRPSEDQSLGPSGNGIEAFATKDGLEYRRPGEAIPGESKPCCFRTELITRIRELVGAKPGQATDDAVLAVVYQRDELALQRSEAARPKEDQPRIVALEKQIEDLENEAAAFQKDAERLESWLAVIHRAAQGSDVPKLVTIMTTNALGGAVVSSDALRAYRARAPFRVGAGDKSGSGSSPAGSVGALCTAEASPVDHIARVVSAARDLVGYLGTSGKDRDLSPSHDRYVRTLRGALNALPPCRESASTSGAREDSSAASPAEKPGGSAPLADRGPGESAPYRVGATKLWVEGWRPPVTPNAGLAFCDCYDDGVMCVLGPGCVRHRNYQGHPGSSRRQSTPADRGPVSAATSAPSSCPADLRTAAAEAKRAWFEGPTSARTEDAMRVLERELSK